jgi:hypothetical protein
MCVDRHVPIVRNARDVISHNMNDMLDGLYSEICVDNNGRNGFIYTSG